MSSKERKLTKHFPLSNGLTFPEDIERLTSSMAYSRERGCMNLRKHIAGTRCDAFHTCPTCIISIQRFSHVEERLQTISILEESKEYLVCTL